MSEAVILEDAFVKIREAVAIVLGEVGRPMTSTEIAKEISVRRLHPLQTKYPGSVVNKAIRRCYLGVETDGSLHEKLFQRLKGCRYVMLAS